MGEPHASAQTQRRPAGNLFWSLYCHLREIRWTVVPDSQTLLIVAARKLDIARAESIYDTLFRHPLTNRAAASLPGGGFRKTRKGTVGQLAMRWNVQFKSEALNQSEGETSMDNTAKSYRRIVLMVSTFLFTVPLARADVVSDWSRTANDMLVAAKAPYSRGIAIVQVAVYEAV